MINEISNSISLVGNVSSVSEEQITKTGKKYINFDMCKNGKYQNKNGGEVTTSEFFSFRLYDKGIEQYKELIQKGNWLHIMGFMHSYNDENNNRKTYFVVNQVRDMKKAYSKEEREIFDYDWLNDPEISQEDNYGL